MLLDLSPIFLFTLSNEWITIKNLVGLDSAFCVKGQRKMFHNVVKLNCVNKSLNVTGNYKYKHLKFTSLYCKHLCRLIIQSSSFQHSKLKRKFVEIFESVELCLITNSDSFCLTNLRKQTKCVKLIDGSFVFSSQFVNHVVGCASAVKISRNHTIYFGEINKLGARHGTGEIWKGNCILFAGYEHTIISYAGLWINDQPNGSGTIRYFNDDIYSGDIVDGKKHGFGKEFGSSKGCCGGIWFNDCLISATNT